MDEELKKAAKKYFEGAVCVLGTNEFDFHFVRIYSSAGDVLVYVMYATQDEAITGAKTDLEVIAELRKPKNARNNKLLSTCRGSSPSTRI